MEAGLKSLAKYLSMQVPDRMGFETSAPQVSLGELESRRTQRVLIKVIGE